MRHRVLIVDDEPRVTEGMERALRKEDYEVISANSAERALEILRGEAVDVVVSDERMPGMCGSELLAIVAREYPETVRIVLSGQASLEAAVRAINDGQIYRFLLKPCNDVNLAITIRQALEHKDLLTRNQELLKTVKRQYRLLHELEREHPGITRVKKSERGVVVIEEECDPQTVLQEIGAGGENEDSPVSDRVPE